MKVSNYILFCLLFYCFNLNAQKNNQIYLHASDTWHRGKFWSVINFSEQYGFGYKRKIWKNTSIVFSYAEWSYKYNGEILNTRYEKCSFSGHDCVGGIYSRKKYKFVDLLLDYAIIEKVKIGSVNVQLGLSGFKGQNSVIDSVLMPTSPPFDNFDTYSRAELEHTIGYSAGFHYNYYFWKKRLSIGLHFKLSKFFSTKQDFLQITRGIQVGVNF